MSKKLLIISFIFLSKFSLAQEKFDYQWVMGYPPYKDSSLFGSFLMDFNDDTLKFISIPDAKLYTIRTTASICDKNGKLLLYSNGCQIHNNKFEVIEGCENVNPGIVWDDYCDPPKDSYPSANSHIILPFPENEGKYVYLTHKKEFSEKYNWTDYNYYTEFYHCNIIDMLLENGKGKSIDHYNIEYPDVVKGFNLAACKHANGKDWWIINFSFNTKKFYRLLLTKDGISGPWEQDDGPPRDSTESIGQSVFSPDGKKYACIYSSSNIAWVMDFDRKTGLLSNRKILNYDIKKDWDIRGVAISPNNKYLYVTADYYIYQYDLEASDIQVSKVLIDYNDGYALPGHPYYIIFGSSQLGPDGKIYVGQFSGSCRQWSVINKPNESGKACDFKQHSILFPKWSQPYITIQPNFRLGPDTTTSVVEKLTQEIEMKCWYNSHSKKIHILIQNVDESIDKCKMTITNISGNTMKIIEKINPNFQDEYVVESDDFSSGLYFVNLSTNNSNLCNSKIVIY